MVRIPGGSFSMGLDGGRVDERPAQTVRVASFELDRTEVTVAAYRACVAVGRCPELATGAGCNLTLPDREEHPANCVSGVEAEAYCSFMGKRLPTAAEW